MNLRNNELFSIQGRHLFVEDTLYLSYSASFLECKMRGQKLEAVMESDGFVGEESLLAWIAVFVDGEQEPRKRIQLKKGTHTYLLYEGAGEQESLIRIMKYSEAAFATVGIVELITDGDFLPYKRLEKPLIAFLGDSITCGYGVEAEHALVPFSTAEENPWIAYACLTARTLDMDFELTSWSGNGIITHYIDPDVNEIRHEKPLMPEMVPYADRELSERLGIPLEKWNPVRKPEILVINLGTNDTSYTRCIPERNAYFQEEFKGFLRELRLENPKAKMIAVYGIMDTRLNQEIQEVVEQLREDGDEALFACGMPLQLETDGRGADFHPSKITHKKVAEQLVEMIKSL